MHNKGQIFNNPDLVTLDWPDKCDSSQSAI